jgi:hypothetical protein
MPRSRPSISLASRQLQSREPRPFAKGSYRSKAQSTPESEEDFSLAAEPIKDRLRVDSGPSSEGRDESHMEALPALDTQHDIGVDADISSEGQADIRVDGSPSPPSSQYSFGMDSAPLPEGLDFDMGLTPPPGAPEWDAADVPQPNEPDEHLDNPSAATEEVIKDIPQPKEDDALKLVRHTPTSTYGEC